MKKLLFFICVVAMTAFAHAQNCNVPTNVTATVTNHHTANIHWGAPNGTSTPARLMLYNQADMVTHPGQGLNGADASSTYGGQTLLGSNCSYPTFYMADDFTLTSAAHISTMDFYAYVTGSTSDSSVFTDAYVSIYSSQPIDSTDVPIWGSNANNVLVNSYWSGIYRVTSSTLTDAQRPIYRLVTSIDTTLPAGTYWVTISIKANSSTPWIVPRADLTQVSTGNGMQYNNGVWTAWQDGASLEQLGLPFTVYGYFVNENLLGFNLYRDGVQLNSDTLQGFSYTDDSLSASTHYCYSVQAVYSNCLSSLSDTACVTTPVDPCLITSLPYYESFDTYGTGTSAYPDCWQKYHSGTSTTYPYIIGTNNSAPGSLYLYASGQTVMAISPLIDASIPMNSLIVGFNARKTSAAYYMKVGVMSDPADPTTFTEIDSISPSVLSTWEQHYVDMSSYTGSGHYIALKSGTGTGINNIYVDDFGIFSRTCIFPESIETGSLTTNSAQIIWHPFPNTSGPYSIEYKLPEDLGWTVVNNLSDTTYTITGLTSNTDYSFSVRVKAECNTNNLYQTYTAEFTTPCEALDIPYYENFDSFTSVGSAYGYPIADCWAKYNTSTGTYPYISSAASSSYSMFNYVYFYTNTSSTNGDCYALLPAFNASLNTLQFECMARESSTTATYVGKIVVGVVTDPVNMVSTFTAIDTISPTTLNYEHFVVSLANYTGGAGRIAVKAPKPTTGYNVVYLDNVAVVPVHTCEAPISLRQIGATGNSITCTWSHTGTAPNSYALQYAEDTANLWQTVSNLTDTFYTITGLQSSSSYKVRVSAQCDAANASPYTFAENFTTLCGSSVQIPYTDSFDSLYSYDVPACWARPLTYFNGSYTYPSACVNAATAHNSSVSIRLFNATGWIATPALNADLHSLSLNFWAYRTATAGGSLQVGVMSDPMDTTTFELVTTLTPTTLSTWQFFELNLDSTVLTGYGNHIVFRTTGTSYFYIDDINIDYIPVCERPVNVNFTNITGNSATVNWNNTNNESSWNLMYKSIYDEEWTTISNISTNTYSLTGLMASSSYLVRVQATCAGNPSHWSIDYIFNTACGNIVSLPYHENFDTYGTGTTSNAIIPTCWTKSHTGTVATYPYINSTHYSGVGSLYFYNTSAYASFGVAPRIDESIQISSLQADFMLYASSVNYEIEIGFLKAPDSVNSFIPVDTLSLSTASIWQEFTVNFSNYTDTARYLAFRTGKATTNYMNVDDFTLEYIPTCFKPTDLAVSSVSQNSLTVSWTPGGSETAWTISYKADSASVWNEINVSTDTFYTITGLDVGSAYNVKIKADCSANDESQYSNALTAMTLCNAITTLPYSENFDNYGTGSGSMPSCWITSHAGATTIYPYINTTHYSSPGALYFYSTTSYYEAAALPEIDPAIDLTMLKVNFKFRTSNLNYNVQVGVMTNPYDITTFTPIQTFASSATGIWEDFTAYLLPYAGTGHVIAFMCGDGTATNAAFIDDITLDYAEDCMPPVAPMASNVTSNSATLSWTSPASVTSWQFMIGHDGFTIDTVTPNDIDQNSWNFTDLQPNTPYDFYVRAICTDGSYTSWSHVSFTTGCASITTIPYTETFDTYGTGSNVFPDCWKKFGNGSAYLIGTNFSAPASLYLYTTATTYEYVVSPEIGVDVNQLQLSFFAKFSNVAYSFEVGVMTDATDTSTFQPIATINARTAVWNDFTVPFTSYQGQGKFIAFRSTLANTETVYIDNLSIDYAPGCIKPINVAVSNIAETSAQVEWTNGHNEPAWQIIYGPSGFNPNVPVGTTTVDVTSHPATITGLTPGTYYDIYVRSDCGSGEFSDWSSLMTFRTACTPISTLPYTESFDTYGTGTTAFPTCWERNTTYSVTTKYPYISTTNYSSPGALYFYSTSTTYNIVTLPPLATNISANTLELRFNLRKTSAVYNLEVGVMTNPYDISSFVIVDTVTPSALNTWEEIEVDFNNYTGNGQYIAFMSDRRSVPGANYMYLDNVELRTIPSCRAPQNLQVTSVVGNSVSLSWTERNEATSWQIAYGAPGFNPDSTTAIMVTTTANPFTLSNLMDGTNYEFYVRSACSATDYSEWEGPINVATLCSTSSTVPYTQNFDSYDGTTYNTVGILPPCWYSYTDGTVYPAPHILGSGSYLYASSTPNALGFTAAGTGQHTYAVLPNFDQPLNTLKMAFSKRMENASSGSLSVGYVTSQSDISSFVPVATITSVTTIQSDSVDFADVLNAPANACIAFYWSYSGSSFFSCCVDDISVMSNITCTPPTNLAVSAIAANTATATWSAGGTETSWVLEYKAAADANYTQITCSTPSYTFANLIANTAYSMRVKAICNAIDESDYSEEVNFTTTSTPVTTYTVTSSCGANGTISPLGAQTVLEHFNISFTITPNTDYKIAHLVIDNSEVDTASTYTFNDVTANHTIYVDFAPTGVADYNLSNAVTLFPNPASNFIDLLISNASLQVYDAQVLDMAGKQVNITVFSTSAESLRFNVNSISSGIYFIRVNTNEGIVVKKFIKK